jgi:cobalamin biosynthesis Mg chelatase CobN
MQRFTRLGATLALGLALVVGPLAAAPASAHGGKIDIELGTDGAGGISASLVWAGDQHPVEESAVVVVRAVSDDGDEVGPITLVSASEGIGWYRSETAVLDEGHWTVTAQVKEPKKAKAETEVDVVAPPATEEAGTEQAGTEESDAGAGPGTAEDTDGAAGADAADGDSAASGAADGAPASAGVPGWTLWVLGALLAAGAVTAVVLRRRTP